MLLSVIIPCYNEEQTIRLLVEQVRAINLDKEVIIVDDHSTDRTLEIARELAVEAPDIQVIAQEKNRGKGSAIRAGLDRAKGEIVIIQDADLEYDPNDYYQLVQPIITGRAEVVFGSRFLGPHTGMYFWNGVGNKVLTMLTNLLYNAWLSDMETCYKVMRTDVLRSLNLTANDFRLEPEIAAKVLRLGYRIYEVPISYMGRTYEEGKKINKTDGLKAILALFQHRAWRGAAPNLYPIELGVRSTALHSIHEYALQRLQAPMI